MRLLFVLALSLFACGPDPSSLDNGAVGGGGGGATNGGAHATNARVEFEMTVYPSIMPTCASCHAFGAKGAPVFFGGTATTSYGAIDAAGLITQPWSSQLVMHGAHTGPALADTQKDIVTTWLRNEIMLRGGDFGGSPALQTALKEIGGCMSYDNWKANGLDKLGEVQTKKDGPCNGCHNVGDGGFLASNDTALTFTKTKTVPFVFRWFMGSVDANGLLNDMVASNSIANKATSALACANAPDCHPEFTLPPGIDQGIRTFVSDTLQSYRNRSCANATSPPPPDAGADH